MEEKEFIQILEERTGQKLGKDFGFIHGTQTAWGESRDNLSGRQSEGFIIWKKDSYVGRKFTVESKMLFSDQEETIKEIVNFLNLKIVMDGNKRTVLYGEYDEPPKTNK